MISIATELLGLLQTGLALASKKADLDKRYFEQFIQPAWDVFNKVHENYKATFETYINSISDANYDVEQLIEKIRTDSIQTEDLRTELEGIVIHLPSAQLKTRSEYLTNFAQGIADYFSFYGHKLEVVDDGEGKMLGYEDSHYSNMIRYEAVIHLARNRRTRKESKDFLYQLIQTLNKRYAAVANAFQQLRTALLA